MDEYVNVSVRIKPILSQDSTSSSCLQVISRNPNVLLVSDRPQTYHFDNIFTDEDNQQTVYNETVKDFVENVKRGYNCTVFAYGQTGTGKTYTMGTNPEMTRDKHVGIIARTLGDFFDTCSENTEIEIFVSFLEIYNEKVFDLLSDNKTPLPLKGFTVQGLLKERICNSHDAQQLLQTGSRNRHTGETRQNVNSSRSHSVFTVYCNVKYSDHETTAKLNLVDLAGSEGVKKTGNCGSTFQEGININKGLLYIGQVMSALSTNSQFVPYRQSTITTILHDSLNVKNYVTLIACVSSNPEDVSETIQTLEFAQRVKKLKNKPEVNKFISKFKRDNPELFSVPTVMTPCKRSTSSVYNTPFKRPKNINLPTPIIQESTNNTIEENFSMEKQSFFDSTKSVLSDVGMQQCFSPVIRKYVNAMENNIMEKLETVICTLKKPSIKEKENTPNWDKIQNTIGKMVCSEIVQFTTKASRATSSPLQEHNFAPKLLNYSNSDCSVEDEELNIKIKPRRSLRLSRSTENQKDNNDTEIFKIPTLSIKNKLKRTKQIKETTENDSFEISEEIFKVPTLPARNNPRRSVRLRQRATEEFQENSPLELSISDKPKNKFNSPRRRSVRLQSKSELFKSRKDDKKLVKSTNETIKQRTKKTLHILNKGSLSEIEKLQTVGKKTAEKICVFRQLNGDFKKIRELKRLPQWSTGWYQRFLQANFLSED